MASAALVVEDELDTGKLLAAHLERWGFEPTVFAEGKPAISWARDNCPELILLDLMLPDMEGYQVCEDLKLESDTNLIPIIMVTALTAPEDKIRGLKVGANRYLTKPFTAEALQRAIEEAVGWRKEIQQRGAHSEIHFRLQSDTQYLEELNDLLSSLFLFSGLSDSKSRQLIAAVREMATNAIEWGHQKQVDRVVAVDYSFDPEKVTIKIRDQGSGFDPKNVPHAAKSEDPVAHMMVREALGLREGGFGILMSKGLVDEMEYNDLGNEVRLVKYLTAKKNGAIPPSDV